MNPFKLAFTTFSVLVFLDYTKKADNIILAIEINLKG